MDESSPLYPRKRRRTQGPQSEFSRISSRSIYDQGLPYSFRLCGHVSCINALAFSKKDGRFLASGGDDLGILLWDFHQEDLVLPSHKFVGPMQNIFCLDFSCSNRYLFAGGVDFQVYQYDVSRLGTTMTLEENRTTAVFREQDSIREITCNPFHEELFISACDNGRVSLHDVRAGSSLVRTSRPQDAIQLEAEVTGVQYHPQTEHLFVTSDSRGNVCLRDTRMGFGIGRERVNNGVVMTYNSKLTRRNIRSHLSNPETSSVTFNAEGSQLAVTMLYYYPTIYALSDPEPVAICSGRNRPDGTPIQESKRPYSNCCTMKHGSFGNAPDDSRSSYYCAGSDNFCAYLWKIPATDELVSQREEYSRNDWYLKDDKTVGSTNDMDSKVYVPVDLTTPTAELKGHKSIVNSTVIHPHFPLIATAGIERDIRLHSPTSSTPFTGNMKRTPAEIRDLPGLNSQSIRAGLELLYQDVDERNYERDVEEVKTISFFDSILASEGEVDPFSVRRWRSDLEEDDDEDDENDDE